MNATVQDVPGAKHGAGDPPPHTAPERRGTSGATRWIATVAMATATPAALGLETALRVLVLPPELEEIRADLRDTLTPVAWGLLVLTVMTVPLGLAVRRAVEKRLTAQVLRRGGSEARQDEARFEAVFVAASLPQIPALLATVTFTAGAAALPVLLTVGLSVVAVLVVAARRRTAGATGESVTRN